MSTATWEPSEPRAAVEALAADAEPSERGPQPFYADLTEFMDYYLAPMIRRRDGGGRRWCAQWWRHAEVVARLTALWHAWETMRLEGGTAMSDWWVHHFDPHYAVLSDDARGPFQACGVDGHSDKLKGLANDPVPADWRAVWGITDRADRPAGAGNGKGKS